MKSQEKTSNYFAMKERRAQQFRETVAQRQKAARDHKVVMYRKYRAGELPDIQIKHSELIVPLQAVAQHDNVLARQLFQVGICYFLLKDKSGVGIIDDKIQDDIAMNGVSYFIPKFAPPPCEITNSNKRFEWNDVISLKRNLGWPIFSVPLSRC